MFEGNYRLVHLFVNLARGFGYGLKLKILDHGSLLPKNDQWPSKRGLNEPHCTVLDVKNKSSAVLFLNPFASSLPTVRLAFLCDLVCLVKNPKVVGENFVKNPGTSHANVGGTNGLDSVWPLPFRRGSWQWQLLWLRHPPYDATPIAPEFPSEGRCQWQGSVGGQQLGFGYTQLVTQRGWGIRGCRGRSYIRSSCNLRRQKGCMWPFVQKE